jgi:hypothetical protein
MVRIYFFAMRNDLLLILGKLEAKRHVKYTRRGRLEGPEPETWNSAADLPKLGRATGDQHVACDPFLIMEGNSPIRVETMTMRDGDDRFDVEQRLNPDSIIFFPGGEWADGALISGSFTTISKSPLSQSLMRTVHSGIKKHFTRVQAFWVGPEALVAFRSGRRLAYAIQSPPEYDLREHLEEGFDEQ